MKDVFHKGWDDYRELVNPLVAVRAELTEEPWQIVRVDGDGRLIHADGRAIEDFVAGFGTQGLGHRPPAVANALRRFLDSDSPSFFTSGPSPYAGALARRLCQRAGGGHYGSAFFASGGSEAVEAALKLARAATGRRRILCFEGAYHGCTFGSVALMAAGVYRDPFAPHLPEVVALPWGDVAAVAAALAAPDVAAIVVEPIQVESGVRALPSDVLEVLCAETARHGVLLIADEIQTGLGRCGRFLASEAWPRRPDVVVLGKTLGGGLMPISAMLARPELFSRAYGRFDRAEAHNSTFSGNALACVAALATLDLIDDALLARVRHSGERWRTALGEAVGASPLVKAVHGDGLLVGVELRSPDHPYFSLDYLGVQELGGQPAAGVLLVHRLFKAGYLTSVCAHAWGTVRMQPPLTLPEDRLLAFVPACREALEALWRLI